MSKVTKSQMVLLHAVESGEVIALNTEYIQFGARKVTQQVKRLEGLGLVTVYGEAVCPAGSRFADYHKVTLTDAGRLALR